jgi:hypothetical protein
MFNLAMVNPYEADGINSMRESKCASDPQGSSKSAQTKLETIGDEARGFKTQKFILLNDKNDIKITANKRMSNWAMNYLPLIQKGKKHDKILQEAIFQGIPGELREVVWFQLIANIHQDYSPLYKQLLDLRESISEKDVYRKSEKLIEKDLHRTFASLGVFKHGNLLHKPLRNILTAFIVHRPDIGYVQGMSYLAGVLLMNLDEIKAFSLFMSLTNWDILYYCF